MSQITDTLFTSFIKGMGNTTGTCITLFVGLQLYNVCTLIFQKTTIQQKPETQDTQDTQTEKFKTLFEKLTKK